MNIEMLETDGFVTVNYPRTLQERVYEAMDSWKEFCKLPMEDKQKLSGGDRINDYGYMYRTDSGPNSDRKELFHILRSRMEELLSKANSVADERASLFITAIGQLLVESSAMINTFASEVEKKYNLSGFTEETMCSQDQWTFRYLHYFGGEMLAHPHTDRGGFTFHLHESNEGGEYLGFDKEWHPWPVSEKQTIIFPSMNLQLRSNGQLKALCHRVQSTPETVESGRYAMVAFIDFNHDWRYNDAGKRLQDFEPGFNYDMPSDEFAGLFVPR